MDPPRHDEKDPHPVMATATPLPPPSAPPQFDLVDSLCCGTDAEIIASPVAVALPSSSPNNNNNNNATSATVVPPPFLIPTGTNTLSKLIIPTSKDWKPSSSSKLGKKCNVIPDNSNSSETKGLRKLFIPISSAETVAFLYAAKKDKSIQLKNNGTSTIIDPIEATMAKHVENNTLDDLKVKRTYRTAILTDGSLQFKKMKFNFSKTLLFDRDSWNVANVNVSLFDLRGVHVVPSTTSTEGGGDTGDSPNDNIEGVVLVAFLLSNNNANNNSMETIRYAAYQTPKVSRFLLPLATALASAYTGRPSWSIPVNWTTGSGCSQLRFPPIARETYAQWMGNDGGFSAAVYAAAVAFCVKRKVSLGNVLKNEGREAVAKCVSKQQQTTTAQGKQQRFLLNTGPKEINLVKLALELSNANPNASNATAKVQVGMMVDALILAGLRALSFNLVLRKLKLSGYGIGEKNRLLFRSALGQALLYNVTLREVDFEYTVLTDLGEMIGVAWAMNAQPLISRVNFSNCKLNGKDIEGLRNGLARIWCGGTALAESIKLANNPSVPAKAWEEFFLAFVDPSTCGHWPRAPPPLPNLSFLQELDVRGTHAIGPGLLKFASKLNGLRTLKFSSNGNKDDLSMVTEILTSLAKAGAPLERIAGENLDASYDAALFAYSATLKELVLEKFRGDAVSLLCGWPQPVPALSMTIGSGYSHSSDPAWSSPSGFGFSPGTLTIFNGNNFVVDAMYILSSCDYENGLKKLTVHNMHYAQLLVTASMLTSLESFLVYPTSSSYFATLSIQRSMGVPRVEAFWSMLAESKTLRDLQLPDQLVGGNDSDELAMVGRFLKTNRSVRRIGFDSPFLLLKVEDVKVLRSAFYGNKKVADLEYPWKARKFTMEQIGEETKRLSNEVALCKREIKKLFQRAYSKYNSRWRDGPNREKLPWVERIRVAKRRIGQIQRDQKKIATLLEEIKQCVHANKMAQRLQDETKANERLVRREGQLEQLGKKKKKFAANLVTKLNKAKLRGRQQKSAKTQLPRSTYYKSPNMWPSNKPPKQRNGNPHSYYNYYNDPYYTRSYWWYYPTSYNDTNDWMYGTDASIYETDDDGHRESDTNDAALGGKLSDVDGMTCEPDDPWSNVDALVQQVESDYDAVLSPEYLALLHEECSELGPDVVENIRGTLDDGAALSSKLDEIGEKTDAPPEMIGNIVDRDGFDLAAMDIALADIPEYEPGDAIDADDVVDMYAGAGPRDLDDGGPSFGSSRHAVLAGARRRARARKASRLMRRVRDGTNRGLQMGYRRVDLITGKLQEDEKPYVNMWPHDLVESWVEETQAQQIKAIAKCSFDLPAVSSQPIHLLKQFSPDNSYLSSQNEIDVVLVTQCSLDRLPNLRAQLTHWTGKASVAIYLKPSECRVDAQLQILSAIEEARNNIVQMCDSHVRFDVAVTLVEGCVDDEPYPINYLRNVALLEARRQHLRLNTSLDKSAVLLVDVDFRPSNHLFKALHSRYAARRILSERQVVVCPAFESLHETWANSVNELKKLVDGGQAEGFHLSHFPQGHGPTQFDLFWEKSMQCNGRDVSEFWQRAYQIKYEDSFEPYIAMASADAPLFDERFQGYGLNKVSHLATIASQKSGDFTVLPGVFLVAPAHERSESWAKRYGTRSDKTDFNRLALKGLYYNFTQNLESGGEPVISDNTRSQNALLWEQTKRMKEKPDECNPTPTQPGTGLKKAVLCY
mmetsp:Transcript_33706/g.70870  ORF Transcript_33706/g.70870 Transcript_33706/m.70870 type:complete len:1720 (+) Transcript_33706:221-5380(+)